VIAYNYVKGSRYPQERHTAVRRPQAICFGREHQFGAVQIYELRRFHGNIPHKWERTLWRHHQWQQFAQLRCIGFEKEADIKSGSGGVLLVRRLMVRAL
jgi:hypothetical protein